MEPSPLQTLTFVDEKTREWAVVRLYPRPGKSILQETQALVTALTSNLRQMQHIIDHADRELCPHEVAWDNCPDCRH